MRIISQIAFPVKEAELCTIDLHGFAALEKGESMDKVENIKIDRVTMEGVLEIPKGARGLVLFAHGSGSSRLSPRNTYVALDCS